MLLAAPVQAQEYQRLHVRSFTLTSDNARPQLEQPFHVTLTIRLAENAAEVRNVFLPTFFGAEELGDVQQIAHSRGGTTYRETLTLVAHARGTLAIGSGYLDAVDARDGKLKRFISNSLQIPVGGGPVSQTWSALRTAALVVIACALAGPALLLIGRRRATRSAFAPVVSVAAPKDGTSEAFDALRRQRDRSAVLRVRASLWATAGARAGETLGDVLRRPAAGDASMRRLLLTVERAAFIEDARLNEAIEEVLCSPRP